MTKGEKWNKNQIIHQFIAERSSGIKALLGRQVVGSPEEAAETSTTISKAPPDRIYYITVLDQFWIAQWMNMKLLHYNLYKNIILII